MVVRNHDYTVVLGKDDAAMLDKLGEPLKVSDVLKDFATEYGFKFTTEDTGGRGAGSSDTKVVLKGTSFDAYLAAKEIKQNTGEADAAYIEWTASNK